MSWRKRSKSLPKKPRIWLIGFRKISSGSYVSNDHLVAFARTQGYQEYDGLGWYGVVVKRLQS
ncbi:hypothetical protein SAMN05216328_15026 [Ensifer sp. YR511]|nr:hypothetical protein SAMN05216328_15026 [Ensifer sp. YR511]